MTDIPENSEEAQWLRNFERMRPEFERSERAFIEWLKQQGKLPLPSADRESQPKEKPNG